MRRQTRHLARLVDDLLEVSRVTRGKMRLQKEPVDLVPIVRAALDNTRPLIDGRNQHVIADLPSARLCLSADAFRLEQVFVNLLQNASNKREPGSTITVTCTEFTDAAGKPRATVAYVTRGSAFPRRSSRRSSTCSCRSINRSPARWAASGWG